MAGAALVRPSETNEMVGGAGAKAQNGKILIAPIEEQKDEGVPTPPEPDEEFYRKPRVIQKGRMHRLNTRSLTACLYTYSAAAGVQTA